MTAGDALDAAKAPEPGERFRRYETICMPRGGCRREPLMNDPGRWTWCLDCCAPMSCELRFHGESYGWEVQFFECGDFLL